MDRGSNMILGTLFSFLALLLSLKLAQRSFIYLASFILLLALICPIGRIISTLVRNYFSNENEK